MTGALIDFGPLVQVLTVLVYVLVLGFAVIAWGFVGSILANWATSWEPYMATAGRIVAAIVVLLVTVVGLFGGVGLIVWQAGKLAGKP